MQIACPLPPLMQSRQMEISHIVAQIGIAVEIWPGERICQMAGLCVITDRPPNPRLKPQRAEPDDSPPGSPSHPQQAELKYSGNLRTRTAHFELNADFFQAHECRKAIGFLCQSNTLDHVWIFFPKAGMLPCTRSQFFTERIFSVPTPCALPTSIMLRHRLEPNSFIGIGSYPIQRVAQGYLMEVKIQVI
jgi:hypothetical protein